MLRCSAVSVSHLASKFLVLGCMVWSSRMEAKKTMPAGMSAKSSPFAQTQPSTPSMLHDLVSLFAEPQHHVRAGLAAGSFSPTSYPGARCPTTPYTHTHIETHGTDMHTCACICIHTHLAARFGPRRRQTPHLAGTPAAPCLAARPLLPSAPWPRPAT